MTDLELMIILLEGEYSREKRNTPSKMIKLIQDEFDVIVSEREILNFYGLVEDYSTINRAIQYG